MRFTSGFRSGLGSIKSLTFLTGFIALGLGACSSDSGGDGGGGGTSSFVGTLVGGTNNDESGSLKFDIAGTALAPPASFATMSSAALTATGTLTLLTPVAGTHPLTGTYDPATNALAITGGGYTFTGAFSGTSLLDGNYTGINGPGLFLTALSAGTAQAFCGTFDGDDDGTWNFVVNDTELSGRALTSSGDVVPLNGTVTAGAVSIVNTANPTGPPLATGTITGPTATGIWSFDQTTSGAWTGNGC